MRKLPYLFILTILLLDFFNTSKLNAQGYLQFSSYNGGSKNESVINPAQESSSWYKMVVEDGETYIATVTTSVDFPVTNGSTFMGGDNDIVLTKYNNTGGVVYSMYLGSAGYDEVTEMKVINGEVFLSAAANGPGFPVTTGNGYHSGTQAYATSDVVLMRIGATGNIIFSTYLGGTSGDLSAGGMQVINGGNMILLGGSTTSTDFPVDAGESCPQGERGGYLVNAFITTIDANNGNIIHSKYLGGNGSDNIYQVLYENGYAYVVGSTSSTNLPVTIGPAPDFPNDYENAFVCKYNINDLTVSYCCYLGGVSEEYATNAKVNNDNLYIIGYTYSPDFPVTDGSAVQPGNDNSFGFYTKLNANGAIAFSTYLNYRPNSVPFYLELVPGNVYIGSKSGDICKYTNSNTLAWSKQLNQVFVTGMNEINGELYIAGNTTDPADGGQAPSTYSAVFLIQFDATGNTARSTIARAGFIAGTRFYNNKLYLLTKTTDTYYTVTDASTLQGDADNMLVILNLDGSFVHLGYIGGKSTEIPFNIEVDNSGVYISGLTLSNDYPVTNNLLYKGGTDQFITKFCFCPALYLTNGDTLTPHLQTTCRYGLANMLTGRQVIADTNDISPVYRNGTRLPKPFIEAIYQWQKAPSAAGPWTDIPNATLKDYVPVMGDVDQYYRRLCFTLPQCGGSLVDTSNVATVLVNNFTAPAVNGGSTRITCPASSITIGGSPTAAGGNPPYSYSWDMNAGNVPNPAVAPATNTIYTVTVTDSLNCKQVGQTVVYVYSANAGMDKKSCGGSPVKIGSTPVTGVAGVAYNWTPSSGISDISQPQPYTNPNSETDYVLTLTIPKTGGGNCSTSDTIKVTPVAAPATPDFAGPDRVICMGDTAYIGTAPEPGFSYYWAPSFYLTSNITSKTKYFGGNLVMPSPNPALINVTAQKNGCAFTDVVEVATIESVAGKDQCGPHVIGTRDRTPEINETYSWSLVSGPGNFTGATNEPIVPVSASVGGNSVYGLTVFYKGHSCYSEVSVSDRCDSTQCRGFSVNAKYRCPNYGVNGGDVTITVLHGIAGDVTYNWMPHVGLTNYSTATVKLTDNISRTYSVTVTSVLDPSVVQYGEITVNNPASSVPVFITPDSFTVCYNTPTQIGMPPVTGNLYQWLGSGLSSNTVSNPVVTTSIPKDYRVKVYDNTGCEITDTVKVFVQNTKADAGPDWLICSNGIAKLGTGAQSNTTYLWEPQISTWQNGTNQYSAEPEVLVATNVSFVVTASTTAGCVSKDTVNVVINNNPTLPDIQDVRVCKGDSVTIGLPALPGVTYQWTPSTGLNNAGIAQPLAGPSSSTIYTLTADFAGNCATTATKQVNVNVTDRSFTMPDIHYCPSGGAVQLGTNAPVGLSFYYWLPYSIITANYIQNATTANPPPNTTTMITLYVYDDYGCYGVDSFLIIPDITAPEAGPDKTVCYHNSATIGNNSNVPGTGITYSWNPTTNLDNAAVINPTFTGNTPGTFQYVLSKTENDCTSKDTVIIAVSDTLLSGLQAPVVCKNSCVQIGVSPLPSTAYQWSPSAGLSNANIANPVACVGSNPVTYSVIATDNYGCINTATVTIGVSATPAPHLNVPNITACVGDTGVRFNPVIGSGPYAYQWGPNNGTINNIYSANPSIAVMGTGISSYTLLVTDTITGCTNSAVGTIQSWICNNSCSMGDYLWFDLNGDGRQDPGEPGVSGMNVKLFNSNDINIATTATNTDGLYSFSNISPGNGYYIVFSKPAGYQFTLQNAGGATALNNSKADASGRSNSFDITSGGAIMNIDAGIKPLGTTPVILLSFTATQQADHSVLLNWQTTAEYNCAYFDVQRSTDGIHFISIGKIDGHGSTSLPNSYLFTDKSSFPGTNYYRLQQVDRDGRFVYSNIVVIENKTAASITALYNASSNTIDIRFAENQNNALIRLLGNNGQLIKSVSAGNVRNYLLQLPAIANGIYILQVMNDKINYAGKFFIRR